MTVAVAGPVATHLLGDLGAEVIRVEAPFARPVGHLDVSPPCPGAPDRPYNRQVGYNDLQRSKRGMTLDVSKPAGRDVLLKLVAVSDAVVENMAPRVLPSLGLSYAELRTARPDIVLVSMPAFGSDGPLRDRVSFGPGIDAMSGLAHLTGYADRGPMNASLYYCDYNAGALAALATIAAIRHRDRTGHGQHVELAMLEGELQLVADALIDYVMNGRVQQRRGNAHPSMAPHGVYPARGDDRWVAVACESDAQWAALSTVIGMPGLAKDARYADVVSRVRNRAGIDALVAAWTSQRDRDDAAQRLAAAGVPASPVQNVEDLFDDEHLAHRGWLHQTQHPEAGAIPHSRAAFTLSGTPCAITRHAPRFGQDNDYVLRELLGLDDHAVAALAAERVIASAPPG
jgi:crotonobetainyl-CoA:carnitine CoA-transferase CaiB-like acyl-CoA transferase